MVDGSQAAGPGPEATPQLSGHPDLSGHSFAPWKGGRGCQNPCAPPPGKGLRQSGGVASQGLLPRDNAETNSPETRTEAKPPTRLPCQVHEVALEANRQLSFLGSSSLDSAFGEDILILFHLGEVNCRPSFLFRNLSPSCREKVADLNASMGSTALSQKTFRYPGRLPVAHRWTVHTAINGSIPGSRSRANKLTCSGFVTRKSE